jgi:phage terminase small subunit
MNIHKRADQFKRQVLHEYDFSKAELAFLDGIIQALNHYWTAADALQKEGLTITAGAMVRKHPALEVSKIAWGQFIGGCKHLGICTPAQDEKRPYGTGP